MARKPLIVGEAPSNDDVPMTPLEGKVGRRLADCCGLTYDYYVATFDRMNLLNVPQERAGKGTSFNVREAGKVARRLEVTFTEPRIVLLLGKRVADAFRFSNVTYFSKLCINAAEAYVVPHPSGVNRWYNDPDNVLLMDKFMMAIVERVRT